MKGVKRDEYKFFIHCFLSLFLFILFLFSKMKITWVMSMVCLVGVVSAAAIQGQEDGVKNKASPAEAKKEEVAEAFDMVKTVEDGSVGIAMMTKQTADRLQKQIQSSSEVWKADL